MSIRCPLIGTVMGYALLALNVCKIFGSCLDSVAREYFSSFFKLSKGGEKEKRETIYTTLLLLKSQFVHSQTLPSI